MSIFPGGKLNHINPILNVAHLQASIDFYTRVLGLELRQTFGEPPNFAIVGRDGLQIYLCENDQGQGSTWLCVFVQDPKGLYESVEKTDLKIIRQAGEDEFRIQDPDGHVLRIMG